MAWRWSANVYFKLTQNNALSELNEIYGKTPNLDCFTYNPGLAIPFWRVSARKKVTPLLTHRSYVSLALIHRNGVVDLTVPSHAIFVSDVELFFKYTSLFPCHLEPHLTDKLCFLTTQIAKFVGTTWGPPGSCRPRMGPMLAPWTLLSGYIASFDTIFQRSFRVTYDILFLIMQNSFNKLPT